jgi:hypothetical protein
MRKIMLALFAWAVWLSPTTANAQATMAFSQVTVKLWPEYDRPAMLVIYDLLLSSETPLPAEMSLRIPAAAGEPYVVAVGPTLAAVSDQNVDYTLRPDGDWLVVTVRLPASSRAMRLEYYDPTLVHDGRARRYRYEWPGDYAVDSFFISFQLPLGATNLMLTPPLSSTRAGSDGLRYYEGQVGPLAAGETFVLTAVYQKESDALSISGLPIQPAGPLDQRAGGSLAWNAFLPWLLGLMGLLLIVGGLAGFFYRQGGSRGATSRRRGRRPPKETSQEEPVYCSQCGKRAQPGDRFCRACGTRLRREQE